MSAQVTYRVEYKRGRRWVPIAAGVSLRIARQIVKTEKRPGVEIHYVKEDAA